MIFAISLLAGLLTGQPDAPRYDPSADAPNAGVDRCLTASPAGVNPTCVGVLQIEAGLAPDDLFSPGAAVDPYRHQTWLADTCAADRLAGRSRMACQAEADARLERSRLARLALLRVNAPDDQPLANAGHRSSQFGAGAVGEASEDCAATRWGVCGSVLDETLAEDDEPAYSTRLELSDGPPPSTHDGQAQSGCRRVRESYRDPATGATGVEVSRSPPNR